MCSAKQLICRYNESTNLSLSSHVEIGNLRNTFNHQTTLRKKSVYLPLEKIPHT